MHALGPSANTDTKLLICGLFQKGRVLAQDGVRQGLSEASSRETEIEGLGSPQASKRLPACWSRWIQPAMATTTGLDCITRAVCGPI